ncbi:MAG: response regulator [Opitutales bacterium]|mgnify:CR=1 FL=1|nr:response regulator [Opitutales bacterium]
MNVIVIEDQILFRDLIVSMLKKDFGLNVLGEHEDGESALAAFFEHRPDLIVLDIKIKKLGGLTVCNRLKNRALI